MRRSRSGRSALAMGLVMLLASPAMAGLAEESRSRRQEVFEFTERPTVTRDGDRVVIGFASKAFCDATVVIEESRDPGRDRIVRHLASGVLGANAPAPFAKDSLKQSIVWDGKDDRGAYVKDLSRVAARVSLGLRPRYERTLHWSAQRRSGNLNSVLAATPEGVYVADSTIHGGYVRVMLLDHAGNYVRTVYPFPTSQLDGIPDLIRREMPQTGQKLAQRYGLTQFTFLTTPNELWGQQWPTGSTGSSPTCTGLAAFGDRVFLLSQRLNAMTSGGGTAGRPLCGPTVFVPVFVPGIHNWPGGIVKVPPRSAAMSPDGKWLYMTGYFWLRSWRQGGLNGVYRMSASGEGTPEVFVGNMDYKTKPGAADGQFDVAASVDVDAKGRVYVADYGNDRIQVFDDAGRHLKSIAHQRPALVKVSPKTGEMYVFSWTVPWRMTEDKNTPKTSKPTGTMSRLGPLEDPKVRASYPLDVEIPLYDGPACMATVDFWADGGPVIWLSHMATDASWIDPNWTKTGTRLLVEKDGRLEVRRDFVKDALRDMAFTEPAGKTRLKVYANPVDGALFIGYGDRNAGVSKAFYRVTRVDPNTGRSEVLQTPFDTEDLAFDTQGFIYLRTENAIARYDPATWREVPFDYGIERKGVGFGHEVGQGGKAGNVVSVIDMPSVKAGGYWHMGGFAISAKGLIAVTCYNAFRRELIDAMENPKAKDAYKSNIVKYNPKLFPGRNAEWAVHVFDQHGKMVYADAIPGSVQLAGLGIDSNDDLYVQMLGPRAYDGKPYFNDISCTLFKAKPKVTRVLSTAGAPVPMDAEARPKRPPDVIGGPCGNGWIEGAEWICGGLGAASKYLGREGGGCWCDQTQMALDFLGRSFVPEPDTYSIPVFDAAGNVILRIGRYGNVDDGMPLVRSGDLANARPLGGDETALFVPRFIAVHTDRRLYISDMGNFRVLSVKLEYHAEEKVALGGK
ncbi:MAG: hypothetical protein PHU85_16815 [Phycisphaerae bacterium]|nr:hypothetical protein [Phycisphaerae bacterium]